MANPYPVSITDSEGESRLSGLANFTDPSNQPGGGSQPGAAIVRKFPFAFNTPGLLTGLSLYVPTIHDVLLDIWLEVTTAWDGTTPLGDVGTLHLGAGVWATLFGQPIDMEQADGLGIGFNNLIQGKTMSDFQIANDSLIGTSSSGGFYAVAGAAVNVAANPINSGGYRALPGKFTTTGPIKVCVSQDGTTSGADPGSTVGAAVLYLVTATPA